MSGSTGNSHSKRSTEILKELRKHPEVLDIGLVIKGANKEYGETMDTRTNPLTNKPTATEFRQLISNVLQKKLTRKDLLTISAITEQGINAYKKLFLLLGIGTAVAGVIVVLKRFVDKQNNVDGDYMVMSLERIIIANKGERTKIIDDFRQKEDTTIIVNDGVAVGLPGIYGPDGGIESDDIDYTQIPDDDYDDDDYDDDDYDTDHNDYDEY